MNIYQFNPVKKFDDVKVSYTFNEQELEAWLNNLSVLDGFASGVKILSLLQALKVAYLEPDQHLAHLAIIKSFADNLIKGMEQVYIDCSYPMQDKEQTSIELVAWINAEIAENFRLPGMSNQEFALSIDHRLYALQQSLQYLGNSLLCCWQAYQQAFDGLWLDCYAIYQFALQKNLHRHRIKHQDTKGYSINKTFKQIVLFSLCDNNQFRPREMLKVFELLGEFASITKIEPIDSDDNNVGNFFFVDQDRPPCKRQNLKTTEKNKIYHIRTAGVAKQLYKRTKDNSEQSATIQAINNTLIKKAVKALGSAHKRNFTRIKESRNCQGIVGFDNLITYIRGEKALDEETGKSYDPRIDGQWHKPDLILVEEGQEWSHQADYSLKYGRHKDNPKIKKILIAAKGGDNKIWQQQFLTDIEPPNEEMIIDFEVIDGSINGYGLLWQERNLKVKIGEVFGIIEDAGQRTEIGLISTIRITNENAIRLGIELIGLEVQYATIAKIGINDIVTRALFLPKIKGIKTESSLIFASSHFLPGELIEIRTKGKFMCCRLKRVIHSTQAISHVGLTDFTNPT